MPLLLPLLLPLLAVITPKAVLSLLAADPCLLPTSMTRGVNTSLRQGSKRAVSPASSSTSSRNYKRATSILQRQPKHATAKQGSL
jgi:hypothetical protein